MLLTTVKHALSVSLYEGIIFLSYFKEKRIKKCQRTIGLLICKTKDNVLAQYATSMVNVPVGISEYEINNLIPDDYKSSMPTIEEIVRELKD